jgi:hypothetical protein
MTRRSSSVVILLALAACGRSQPEHDVAVVIEAAPSVAEPASAAPIDPDEAMRQAARALADAQLDQSPIPALELRVDVAQLERRRRRENPSPSPDWPEPATTWGPALELPGPQLDRDMPWYPEHAPGACELEFHRWPLKFGPHDEGVYTRVFVVASEHDQPSVLWVDRLDDGRFDVEVRARWLTPSRLAAIEERPRTPRSEGGLGKRWEYGVRGELLGGWVVSWGFDGQAHERNEFLIDYDERTRPNQVRHYDYDGSLYVLGRVTWDERPLRLDNYRPSPADPGVYALDSSLINIWQDGWLRQDRLAITGRVRTSIHTDTPAGLQSVLHVIHRLGSSTLMEVQDGGRMLFEHDDPPTRFERRQTYLVSDGESLPLTREAREGLEPWRVEERWNRTPDRVEHWRGDELVTVAYLDCSARPRPERLGF